MTPGGDGPQGRQYSLRAVPGAPGGLAGAGPAPTCPPPCPVSPGSGAEPSTASSSPTWKNTGPSRDCASKSRTRTRPSVASCSWGLRAGTPRPVPPAAAHLLSRRLGTPRPPGQLALRAPCRPRPPFPRVSVRSVRPSGRAPPLPPAPVALSPSARLSEAQWGAPGPCPPALPSHPVPRAAFLSGSFVREQVDFLATGPDPSSTASRPDLSLALSVIGSGDRQMSWTLEGNKQDPVAVCARGKRGAGQAGWTVPPPDWVDPREVLLHRGSPWRPHPVPVHPGLGPGDIPDVLEGAPPHVGPPSFLAILGGPGALEGEAGSPVSPLCGVGGGSLGFLRAPIQWGRRLSCPQ